VMEQCTRGAGSVARARARARDIPTNSNRHSLAQQLNFDSGLIIYVYGYFM
jgi:hypothetical protein